MSGNGGRTRRELLADAARGAAAASLAGLAGCFPGVGGSWPETAPKGLCTAPDAGATSDAGSFPAVTPAVVDVYRADSVVRSGKYVIHADVVATMLDAGLAALARQVMMFNAGVSTSAGGAGADDSGQYDVVIDNPWKILLPDYSGQRIGLKVNTLNGFVPTSPAIVRAIIASLRDKMGVDTSKIVVWDRYLSELAGAGKYSADDLAGAQLLGTLTKGYDSKTETEDMVTPPGLGYGDAACGAPPDDKGSLPRLSRILTDPSNTELTINCPVFKTHSDVSGITAAFKNIYGMIDNPGHYHFPLSNTALPQLYALPAIRKSIRLTIVDALVAVINGQTSAQANAGPGRILLAQDPVALDSYALDLMNQLRASSPGKMGPVDSTQTVWLDNAELAGLGTKKYTLIQV